MPFLPNWAEKKGLEKGIVSLQDYKIILEKIAPYAKQIHLYNWGEPFLNKDLLSIVEVTAKKNIFTAIHSNLSFKELCQDEADDIVKSGLSFLSVSLDGASQETYEKYRVGGNFQRVVDNIKKIQTAIKRLGRDMPIRWQFLINAFNEHEQDKARNLAEQLQVILHFDLMGVKENSWASSQHNKSTQDQWPKVFYHKEIPPEIYDMPERPVQLHKQLKGFCIQPFNWMTINQNGAVTPCCAVYGDEYLLGNIYEQELKDIWNGTNFQKCREFLTHYGPKQTTRSICELKDCPMKRKSIDACSELNLADLHLSFLSGIWLQEGEEWLWLENVAEAKLSAHKTGTLSIDLIFPNIVSHTDILPMATEIFINNKNIFQTFIQGPGKTTFTTDILKGREYALRILSDAYIIPDENFHNGDKRRLSILIDNLVVQENAPEFFNSTVFLRDRKNMWIKKRYSEEQIRTYLSKAGHKEVNGWLSPLSLSCLFYLSKFQDSQSIIGDIAEIGVHHGRFFIALCLMLRLEEHALAIDVFEEQQFNLDGSGRGDRNFFTDNLNRYLGTGYDVDIFQIDSKKIKIDQLLSRLKGNKVRLFSVDGCHTVEHTESDLLLASQSITPGGVIILDDFENEEWPGVVTGVQKFLRKTSSIVPVAMAYNKLYLTTLEYRDSYLDFLYDITASQTETVSRKEVFGHEVIDLLVPPPETLFSNKSLKTYKFAHQACSQESLVHGWYSPEPWGVWSDGSQLAQIQVEINCPCQDMLMTVLLHAFVTEEYAEREIDILVNSKKVDAILFSHGQDYITWDYSLEAGQLVDNQLSIAFVVKNPVSPFEAGVSADERQLGVGLREISFICNS